MARFRVHVKVVDERHSSDEPGYATFWVDASDHSTAHSIADRVRAACENLSDVKRPPRTARRPRLG